MRKLATVLTIPMCLGLAVAQEARTTPRGTDESSGMGNQRQSWVGILVDSNCSSTGMSSGTNASSMRRSTDDKGSLMNKTTPGQSGRDWNSTDRNTAGAADRTGLRESDMNRGTPAGAEQNSADRRDATRAIAADGAVNRTGPEMARTTPQTSGGMDQATGAKNPAMVGNAQNWDKSCFISTNSSSFALQLQDGRRVNIDAAGNSKISSQLQSTGRVSSKSKVFRVRVKGSMEGDTLHLTDIQI